MTRVISASTGLNGVSLAIISPKQARYVDLSFFIVFFETDINKELFKKG